MSRNQLIEEFEAKYLKELSSFKIGDTVRIHTRIKEGQKERVQVFSGTVIAKKGGGVSETFSVYRHAYGCGVERVFCLHSPNIAKIEVVRSGRVRRAKPYYLRGTSGKASKLKQERMVINKKQKSLPKVEDKPSTETTSQEPATQE